MKKKVMIVVIIVLILLFPFFKNTFKKYMAPDKVLVVGHHISDHAFTFTKEIKDQKKIAEYENLFNQIKFSRGECDEDTYPDIILQINHKTGIFTHPLHIWMKGDEGIALIWTLEEPEIGKLSSSQVETLKRIIQ
ncbi:MAG: hypothetical protein GX892_01680 [Thermoanaerobacteraceae bacterium]|uniref:hypothetical protein n=1 Tax=Tepidanaerobacter sp. GT38 TaxID=2722793 RepID=UPI001834E165|nr:hypothetical protein [Tepidanaerobacter sp. GT38]MCG1013285.1 hypothetical protein [Tepidanaerobacter sp. GT38]NLZ51855.1 hypothetical protein [Thermoanaerobacteraceae bacterium]